MSFMAKDVDVLDKYNELWDKIKNKLNIKFQNFRTCIFMMKHT